MTLHGSVLVGTDLSPSADEALRQGAQLADGLRSPLLVCHVVPELVPNLALFARYKDANRQVEQSILATAREAVQQHVGAVLQGRAAPPEVVLDCRTPHVGLLSAAEETRAGVIVAGPGATALSIVRHASCPVLIARSSPAGPVVGTTDFSDPSLPAVAIAVSEARRRGTPLHLLHAWDLNVFTERRAPPAAMSYLQGKSWIALEGLDELQMAARRRLEETLRDAGVPGEVAIVSGSAPEVIVEYAETVGAGLLVVGTHGRSGFERLTLGSTATSVVERSPCSVLVVRMPHDEDAHVRHGQSDRKGPTS